MNSREDSELSEVPYSEELAVGSKPSLFGFKAWDFFTVLENGWPWIFWLLCFTLQDSHHPQSLFLPCTFIWVWSGPFLKYIYPYLRQHPPISSQMGTFLQSFTSLSFWKAKPTALVPSTVLKQVKDKPWAPLVRMNGGSWAATRSSYQQGSLGLRLFTWVTKFSVPALHPWLVLILEFTCSHRCWFPLSQWGANPPLHFNTH